MRIVVKMLSLSSSIMGNFQGSHCTVIDDPDEIEKLFAFNDKVTIDNQQRDASPHLLPSLKKFHWKRN